jgi:hypothetical protein
MTDFIKKFGREDKLMKVQNFSDINENVYLHLVPSNASPMLLLAYT